MFTVPFTEREAHTSSNEKEQLKQKRPAPQTVHPISSSSESDDEVTTKKRTASVRADKEVNNAIILYYCKDYLKGNCLFRLIQPCNVYITLFFLPPISIVRKLFLLGISSQIETQRKTRNVKKAPRLQKLRLGNQMYVSWNKELEHNITKYKLNLNSYSTMT